MAKIFFDGSRSAKNAKVCSTSCASVTTASKYAFAPASTSAGSVASFATRIRFAMPSPCAETARRLIAYAASVASALRTRDADRVEGAVAARPVEDQLRLLFDGG